MEMQDKRKNTSDLMLRKCHELRSICQVNFANDMICVCINLNTNHMHCMTGLAAVLICLQEAGLTVPSPANAILTWTNAPTWFI